MQRGLELSGLRATAWLAERGWAAPTPQVRVFADVFSTGHFGISRIWHNAERLTRVTTDGHQQNAADVLLVVDGSATITMETFTYPLTPGSLVLLGPDGRAVIQSGSPLAVIEIHSDSKRLGLPSLGLRTTEAPFDAPSDYWRPLALLANQILDSSISAEQRGVRGLRLALENLVVATLEESLARTRTQPGPSHSSLLLEVTSIIRTESHDPAFNVARLARLANVSRSHLHRIFASVETTPFAEIRAIRLQIAREQMARTNSSSRVRMGTIALNSGFTSATALRRALRHESGHSQSLFNRDDLSPASSFG